MKVPLAPAFRDPPQMLCNINALLFLDDGEHDDHDVRPRGPVRPFADRRGDHRCPAGYLRVRPVDRRDLGAPRFRGELLWRLRLLWGVRASRERDRPHRITHHSFRGLRTMESRTV